MADPIITPPAPTIAPIPAPTATSVYSAPNISMAATSPALPINPALEEYNAFLNTPELTAAKNEVARLQQTINQERQGLRNTTTGLEYQNDKALGSTGASMNLIGRQVGRASQLASDRIAGLGEQFSAAQAFAQGLEATRREQFNVYTQEKQRIQSLIAQTGNQAGIKVTDSFEVATEKAFKWEQEQAKKAKKEAYKDSLKAELRALGKSTSGSTKELEKKLKKYNKKALAEAKSRSDKEWEMKVAQFNKSMAGGSVSGNGSKIQTLLSKAANMTSGGAEWAKKNAKLYGLTEAQVTPYLEGNWGDGFRTDPKSEGVNLVELGNGKLLDKNTGDIFEVE